MIVAITKGRLTFFNNVHEMKDKISLRKGKHLVCEINPERLTHALNSIYNCNPKLLLRSKNFRAVKVIESADYQLKTLHIVDLMDCTFFINDYLFMNNILTEQDIAQG